jgi:DNA-binding PadR family transcriptional regulator
MPAEADIPPKTITPRIAVLSLVVQQADTAAGVSRRLKEQFPAAQFPESSAHNNMGSLAEKGYLRLVEEGPEPSLNRYEATDEGDKLSRQWRLRASLPPRMRDTLQGKLAFVGQEEIRVLIRLVREEERAFRAEYDRAQSRKSSHMSFREAVTGIDCQAELQAIKLGDEVALASVMVWRRMKVRKALEELLVRLEAG